MRSEATKRRFRNPVAVLAGIAVSAQLALHPMAAHAQNQVSVVRDAEIEALVKDYARPIFKAAGLSNSGLEIVLVNDPSFNAFVTGRRMFINTGALATAATPNEIIGVIAHEAGHVAGGHEFRLREQLSRAQTTAIISALVGLGAAVAGAATHNSGLGQAGTGIFAGGGELARRNLLSYQRGEEATADRSAITYLNKTGQSGRGMLTTFERFQSSMALSGARINPYTVSHPMPRERIANLQNLVHESRYFDRKDPPSLQLRHDLMRAKIIAYTQGRGAMARAFQQNSRSLPARYGDAIVTYLHGNPRSALQKIDALIRDLPGDAYFHELRGDILVKANRPDDGAKAYATAIKLDSSGSGLLRVGRGQALLATGRPDAIKHAIDDLRAGLDRDPDFAAGYRFLAQAYGRTGDIGLAELATAEGHYHSGNFREAKIFAARAQQKMKRGSPPWLRADDIIKHREPGK